MARKVAKVKTETTVAPGVVVLEWTDSTFGVGLDLVGKVVAVSIEVGIDALRDVVALVLRWDGNEAVIRLPHDVAIELRNKLT
jgi:hypothetical protein